MVQKKKGYKAGNYSKLQHTEQARRIDWLLCRATIDCHNSRFVEAVFVVFGDDQAAFQGNESVDGVVGVGSDRVHFFGERVLLACSLVLLRQIHVHPGQIRGGIEEPAIVPWTVLLLPEWRAIAIAIA